MTCIGDILGHLHMEISDFFADSLGLWGLVTGAEAQLIETHDIWVECKLIELQKRSRGELCLQFLNHDPHLSTDLLVL